MPGLWMAGKARVLVTKLQTGLQMVLGWPWPGKYIGKKDDPRADTARVRARGTGCD